MYLGDEDKYQFHCQATLANFENAYEPGIASRLAKVCLLRPDLQDPKVIPTLYELSEFASGFESADEIRWYYATRALVEVRRGDPKTALEWNKKTRENEGRDDTVHGYLHATSHAIDALAYRDLGDTQQSERSLGIGRTLHAAARKKAFEDGHDSSWVDWQVFQILEREATQKPRVGQTK